VKKLWFLAGVGAGFLLGSRAGRGPYEQVEAKVRELGGRPEVQQAVGQVTEAAKGQAGQVAEKVTDKLPGTSNGATEKTGQRSS
jgi:hypothetical protein